MPKDVIVTCKWHRIALRCSAEVTHTADQTGFQWNQETRYTAIIERERSLLQGLMLITDTEYAFNAELLGAPLHSIAVVSGFGAQHTIVHNPSDLTL